jgi:putative nucleotidyltransferase with HDIG domain
MANSPAPTREQALALWKANNESDALLAHALSVEAVMRHFARLYGEDEEKWGVIGLVHDIDYERHPQEHCRKSVEILSAAGWPPSTSTPW